MAPLPPMPSAPIPPQFLTEAPIPPQFLTVVPPMSVPIPPQPMVDPIPSVAPIPTVPVASQNEENAVEEVDDDVVMEDVTVKKPESNDDSKEKEAKLDQQPEAEPEVNPLETLMECIKKCKASSTLKMTMKGWNKKASIELRFTFSGTFNFDKKEKVISREEVVVVKRSKECLEKQTEMEQKEEEQQEADYIA